MRLALMCLLLCACNGLSQSPECAQYLECVEAISAGGSAGYASSYGPSGTCWSTDQRSADACTAVCVQGRQSLAFGAGAGRPQCQ